MNRKEKLENLELVFNTLKKEFVGIDKMLDEIKQSITSWYVTPEILTRPVVVQLWGMTGTGKTSVIKRLTELLKVDNSTLFFDCGSFVAEGNNKDITATILDSLGGNVTSFTSLTKDNPLVYVWDDFHNARTLNEFNMDQVNPNFRPVWSLLDNGIIDLSSPYSWSFNNLQDFIFDFTSFAEKYSDIEVTDGEITDPSDLKKILDSSLKYTCYEDTVNTPREINRLSIIPSSIKKGILVKANSIKANSGLKEINGLEDLLKSCNLGQIAEKLREIMGRISKPIRLDCSNSLVFILGNLDDAFNIQSEIDPDFDADYFYEISTKVGVSGVKASLLKLFKPEQLSRLGNNLIIYPSLSRSSFETIIKREVSRILTEFKTKDEGGNLDITVDKSFYDLLYTEGVYPVQGVRPVLSTISSILMTVLSKIIIHKPEEDTKLIISTQGNSRSSFVEVLLDFEGHDVITIPLELQLGKLRDVKERDLLIPVSVHEIGHAVVCSYCKHRVPDFITATSPSGGGSCFYRDVNGVVEIQRKKDIDNEVMIALAGFMSEKVLLCEKDNTDDILMGSYLDLGQAWDCLSHAAYETGYFEPRKYANETVELGPKIASGFSDEYIKRSLSLTYSSLTEIVSSIIQSNKLLIKEAALVLAKKGMMTGEEFSSFIEKYKAKEITWEDDGCNCNNYKCKYQIVLNNRNESKDSYYLKKLEDKIKGNSLPNERGCDTIESLQSDEELNSIRKELIEYSKIQSNKWYENGYLIGVVEGEVDFYWIYLTEAGDIRFSTTVGSNGYPQVALEIQSPKPEINSTIKKRVLDKADKTLENYSNKGSERNTILYISLD